MTNKKVIALFDVDGTLTAPRKVEPWLLPWREERTRTAAHDPSPRPRTGGDERYAGVHAGASQGKHSSCGLRQQQRLHVTIGFDLIHLVAQKVKVGIVGGSDLVKVTEQLGDGRKLARGGSEAAAGAEAALLAVKAASWALGVIP